MSRLRRGATEEEEEKEEPGVSEEKQKPHTEMWGKTPREMRSDPPRIKKQMVGS